jgi:hypothetical protein
LTVRKRTPAAARAWAAPAPSCANLTIARTTKSSYGDDVVIEARDNFRQVGVIAANHVGDPLGLQVSWIKVDDRLRRCGVATRLYAAMAKVACDAGGVLSSDVIRKPAAEAFWQKQVAKGRARCVRRAGNSWHPDYGLGDCEAYALTQCPAETLARATGGGRRASAARRRA